MLNIKHLLLSTLLIVISIYNSFGQSVELIKFLDAYKTFEFDESKKVINDYSFNLDDTYKLSDYGSINGLSFNADTSNIKGYEAIINCKVENELHQLIDKRMMVVMYFDKLRKTWAVFAFREAADATHEYNIAKNDAEANKFYTKKEFVYRNLAYWCIMAGKLKDAKKYIELGIAEAKLDNNLTFTTNIDTTLKAIL